MVGGFQLDVITIDGVHIVPNARRASTVNLPNHGSEYAVTEVRT